MNVRFFLILSLLLASCSSLPEIRPSADAGSACPSPFVVQKTRFIHTIEAAAAGETRSVMIGVTVADPASRTLSCALMSPALAALRYRNRCIREHRVRQDDHPDCHRQ